MRGKKAEEPQTQRKGTPKGKRVSERWEKID